MCAICGKIALTGIRQDYRPVVRNMSDQMLHRGPDDHGIYSDEYATLGHRRLSIIDLETGKQPISNEDGSVWTVFNGEIYNFRELRARLVAHGHRFATATDTEVIVHAYEEFGDACVSELEGMFAFAIWDSRTHSLLLARDRVGIKPLYYLTTSTALLFASELKALLADPDCPRKINPAVIGRFLTNGYSAGPETPLMDLKKLEPGHFLKVSNGVVTIRQYWDLAFPVPQRNVSFKQAQTELLELLDRTIRAHMISDVPLGVLLSGGVDSCGVLSFAAEHAGKPLHSFTIGFEGEQLVDERPYAQLAAMRYGTQHHEITIGPQEFRQFLPKYVWHMEELVCEPPAVALHFVTKLARDHGVKVVLSGEGGDEAFGGYNTYPNQLRIEGIRRLPRPWPQVTASLAAFASRSTGSRKMAKVACALQNSLETRYVSRTSDSENFFARPNGQFNTANSTEVAALFAKVQGATSLSRMLYVDTKTWLPDDLLVKADKITMANSVELRVPLLDHHVLEFAAGLPDGYKVQGNRTKYILKEALSRRVPQELLNRRKAGFPVPVGQWLRSELYSFAQDILSDSGAYTSGFLGSSTVRSLLTDHQQRGTRTRELFSLIVLELWHRQFLDIPVVQTAVQGR